MLTKAPKHHGRGVLAALTALVLLFSVALLLPAQAAPSVTAVPQATSAPINAALNVNGTVSGFPGNVEIRTEVWVDNSRWSIHQRKTATNGNYSMPLAFRAGQAGTHKWRVVATNGTSTVASAQFAVTRTVPKVTATPAATNAAVNQPVNVNGTVSGFPGRVEIRTEVWVDNSRWSIHQRKTVTNGNYSMPLAFRAGQAGTHKWRVVATNGTTTVASAQFSLSRSVPKVTAKPSVTTAAVNATVNVTGTLTGFPKAVQLRTEVWVDNNRWSIHQRKTVTNGNYSMPLAFGANQAGTLRWRVVATDGTSTVASAAFNVTRTAAPPTGTYNEYRGPNWTNRVTLTYDDCPKSLSAFRTVLTEAKSMGISLALFPTGDCIRAGRFDASFARSQGHYVFNHSISHPDLRTLSRQGVINQLGAPGVVTSYGRPPYGAVNSTVRSGYAAVDMRIWLWNVDTNDWRGKSQSQVVNYVVNNAKAGNSVLMHMQWNGFNASAIRQMRDGLSAKGIGVCRNNGPTTVRPAAMNC